MLHAPLRVYDIPRVSVRWSTESFSARINDTSSACASSQKAAAHWSLLLPLITASVSHSRRGGIFNAKWAALLLHMLTTNQFHYSVFCLQLEEMLDKMSKINRACESGCQSSPADGHFMNSSESEYVWQLCMYTLCYSWGDWEKVRVLYSWMLINGPRWEK